MATFIGVVTFSLISMKILHAQAFYPYVSDTLNFPSLLQPKLKQHTFYQRPYDPINIHYLSDSSKKTSSSLRKSKESLMDEAMELKKQAEKARLEAEQMDTQFTLSKISNMESQISQLEQEKSNDAKRNKKIMQEKEDLISQLNLLRKRMNATSKKDLDKTQIKSSTNFIEEELVGNDVNADANMDNQINQKQENISPPNNVEEEISISFDAENNISASSFIALNSTNLANDTDVVPSQTSLSSEKFADLVEGFDNLPSMIRYMIANSVGISNGDNTTLVIETMIEKGKINVVSESQIENGLGDQSGNSDDKNEERVIFELDNLEDADVIDLYIEELENADRDRYIEAILPKSTRKYEDEPTEEDLELLYQEVFGMKIFNPTNKPDPIPGGFIVRGENRIDGGFAFSDDQGKDENLNDEMILELDKSILNNAGEISDKILCCYIMDPTPFEEPELDVGQDLEEPVLVVFGKNLQPEINPILSLSTSILGLGSIAVFTIGSLSFNGGLTTLLQDANVAGNDVVSILTDTATPLFLYILGIQLVHEVGHRLIAFRDKFGVGLPILIPSLQTGLTGCVTPIKTPPKNLKSLFDFAIAGPLLGMLASISSLFIGLQQTVEVYSFSSGSTKTVLSSFPALPIEFLKLSSLGGGIVEMVIGSGALLSSDPSNTVISLHPLAVAGYVGILTNALSLLPIGSTDGGRISLALFGRPLNRFVQSFTVFFLIAIGFFGFDESNVLLTYVIFAFWTQRENEIPCRNEVDDIDFGRVLFSIASLCLVILALTPIT